MNAAGLFVAFAVGFVAANSWHTYRQLKDIERRLDNIRRLAERRKP